MTPPQPLQPAGVPKRALIAWCLFDWANSAFPTVVQTFVFSTFFVNQVAADPELGNAQLGLANSLTAAVIAIGSPVIGAIADRTGRRKPWLLALSLLCIASTASLWFVTADGSSVVLGLLLLGVATLGFEFGITFYNAMLADLAPSDRVGRLSGWGWGLGYAGGLACLLLGKAVFVDPDPSWLGLDRAALEHVRIVMPMAAAWFALFAVPLFLLVPDPPSSHLGLRQALRLGLSDLAATLRQLRRHANIARFLLAKMIYIDGLNTLFLFGGTYAGVTMGMSFSEVLTFGIILNVSAGLGAAAFAWVDDLVGAKPTIAISLACLALLGGGVLLVDDKTWFLVLAVAIGIFLGPTQAASRSLMARLAPPAQRAEFFGLYNFAGKATAFVGPAVFGWATWFFDSQRAGMATLLPFFLIGLLLLLTVRSPQNRESV